MTDKDSYVFDVMANYQNASLARQKIWLNKSDYAPKQVEVTDSNASVLVDVKFDTFKFNEKLDKSVFDTKANLQTAPAAGSKPTMAVPDGGGSGGKAAGTDPAADSSSASIAPMEPSYLGPDGIALKDTSDIELAAARALCPATQAHSTTR